MTTEDERQRNERRCPKCGHVAALSRDGYRLYCRRCGRRWRRCGCSQGRRRWWDAWRPVDIPGQMTLA